jgi:hypothetical protein
MALSFRQGINIISFNEKLKMTLPVIYHLSSAICHPSSPTGTKKAVQCGLLLIIPNRHQASYMVTKPVRQEMLWFCFF